MVALSRARSSSSQLVMLLALVMLVAVAPASADDAAPQPPYGRKDPLLPLRLDGHVGMTWNGGAGLGARAEFPLVTSFRYAPRDELALSVGADVAFLWFDGTRLVETYPSVSLQWSLGVNDRFYFVPELGIGARILDNDWDRVIPSLAFGARYYLTRSFGLAARLGWPFALSVGTVF